MSTKFGRNLKITVDVSHRDAIGALFTNVFGANVVRPAPHLEQFKLADGFSVGVFYVEDGTALTEAQQMAAPWLELAVDDLEAARERLDARGIKRIPYDDTVHSYHQIPGGPVFRLAVAC